jgi:hypothetical protein
MSEYRKEYISGKDIYIKERDKDTDNRRQFKWKVKKNNGNKPKDCEVKQNSEYFAEFISDP